jgi:hypothetical protein
MSLPMILGQWSDLIHRPPPEVVTQRVAARSGLWLEGRPLGLSTIAAHLAFGATAGAFFTSATEVGRVRAHRATLGPLYGIAVWALAYLGALPRLGLIASQESVGRRRDLVMLVAHLLFGITLVVLTKGLSSRSSATVSRTAVR